MQNNPVVSCSRMNYDRKQNSSDSQSEQGHQIHRRRFLSSIPAAGLGPGILGSRESARAERERTVAPDVVQGPDWSSPEDLPKGSRDEVIEWDGTKFENTALQEAVGEEHEELQGVPLWNLYTWRLNQNKIPSQPNEEGNGLLSGFSVTGFFGPVGVTADLGEVGETVRNKYFEDEDGFVTQIATDVFADQVESDYSFVDEVDICGGVKQPSVRCYGGEVPYTNSSADIRSKLTFEASHTVEVDWWSNYDITYRAFHVVQTYDTTARSPLNKTFVAVAAVFPEEIDGVDLIEDHDFVSDSRKFMKNVK